MAPCGLEGTQGFTPSQRCKIRALNAHDSFGVVDIYPIIQIAGFRLACIPRIYFDFLFILNLDFFNKVLLLLASKRVSRSVHGGQAAPRSWVEEERTNPCRCQPWALDIGHYAALKTLKDLSAKTLVLFISQILPWLFWGLQPVVENLFFSEQQCPEQPNASQLLEGWRAPTCCGSAVPSSEPCQHWTWMEGGLETSPRGVPELCWEDRADGARAPCWQEGKDEAGELPALRWVHAWCFLASDSEGLGVQGREINEQRIGKELEEQQNIFKALQHQPTSDESAGHNPV